MKFSTMIKDKMTNEPIEVRLDKPKSGKDDLLDCTVIKGKQKITFTTYAEFFTDLGSLLKKHAR